MLLPDLAEGREALREELELARLFATPAARPVLDRWRVSRPDLVAEIDAAVERCRGLWRTGKA